MTSTDDQGLPSSATRRFWVNSTLGFLRVAPPRLLLPPKGAQAAIAWTQAQAARVRVTVTTFEGILVRTIAARRLESGAQAVTWNGRLGNGKLTPGGRYVVRVAATNELGAVELEGRLIVRRIAKPRR